MWLFGYAKIWCPAVQFSFIEIRTRPKKRIEAYSTGSATTHFRLTCELSKFKLFYPYFTICSVPLCWGCNYLLSYLPKYIVKRHWMHPLSSSTNSIFIVLVQKGIIGICCWADIASSISEKSVTQYWPELYPLLRLKYTVQAKSFENHVE